MRVIDLVVQRAEQVDREPAVIFDSSKMTYRDLLALVERSSKLISSSVPPNGGVLLGVDPLDKIVGFLASMMAERVVILGVGRNAADKEPRGCTHLFQAGGISSLGVDRQNWVEAVDGFAFVVETSGTTGKPKLVVHDNRSLAANIFLTASVEDELHGDEAAHFTDAGSAMQLLVNRSPHGLRFLSGMPLTSIAGLSMLMRAIAMGEQFAVPPSIDPPTVWESAISLAVSNVGLPPFTAGRFASFAEDHSRNRPALLHLGIGGSFADPNLVERLESGLDCLVTVGFGATELGGVAIMSRPWDAAESRWETIGRPLNGVDVVLQEVDKRGSELLVRTPAIARGVVVDGELRELEEWFHTGDLATITKGGLLTVGGRVDFVISRGAHRIDPARIEAFIERHPLVDRCGVAGVPSRISGNEDIIAFVTLNEMASAQIGFDELLSGIRQDCIRSLAIHEVPRRVRIVENIPLAADSSPDRLGLSKLTRF